MTQWHEDVPEEAVIGRLVERFRDAFDREPAGVWSAPGRVNVIGEHVDYNGGLCLPFALRQRTYVALAPRSDDGLRLASLQAPGQDWSGPLDSVAPGGVTGWAAYAAGVPWALRRDGLDVPGFDALFDGHVPLGAGLSSSAAIECALAVALDDVAGLGLGSDHAGRARLAEACREAENRIAGAPTGGLDQATSLRCPLGEAMLLDLRDLSVTPVPFDLESAGLRLLVVNTHVRHALADGQYRARREACEEAARLLGVPDLRAVSRLDAALATLSADPVLARRVRHVVTEIDRVRETVALCAAGDLAGIGEVLSASHASLRDDFEVSCAELDLACTSALGAGALGARMVGGGFGGSALALVRVERVAAVARAVDDAFRGAGHARPTFIPAAPGGPAGRSDL